MEWRHKEGLGMPLDLDAVANSFWGKTALGAFRLMLLGLLSVLAWGGHLIYAKIDNAADKIEVAQKAAELKAEVNKSNEALWGAIRRASDSLNALSVNMQVMQAQFKSHEVSNSVIESNEKDHEARLRAIESKGRP